VCITASVFSIGAQSKRRYLIKCARCVSEITFIRDANSQNIGKPNNLNEPLRASNPKGQ
jgi:hypothetical protein